jgi:hypothetical protein
MEKKILVTFTKNLLVFDEEIKKYVDIVPLFTGNVFVRVLRRLFRKLNITLPDFLYNSKIKELACDTIIIFEACMREQYFKFIQKYNKQKRIILWYWNPVNQTISPDIIPNGIEKWSYSMTDCNTYGLNYNTQFYLKSLAKDGKEYDILKDGKELKYDILYVGADKGRRAWLKEFERSCMQKGLFAHFIISSSNNQKSKANKDHDKGLSYNEIVKLIIDSRAILDYYADNTAGISLRPLEALFFDKKLITNSVSAQSLDFFSKENVFILGKDCDENLVDFINSPLKPIDEAIIQKYDFQNWLKGFDV